MNTYTKHKLAGLCVRCSNMATATSFLCAKHYEYERNRGRCRLRQLRIDCIDAYGGKCICCGINNIIYLNLDHINGGGNKHRTEIGVTSGSGGFKLLRWLKANSYPPIIC